MGYGCDETALFARFSCYYRHTQSAVMGQIERNVFGCNYGATSWTTQPDADRIARLIGLGPDKLILDIGCGSGWPALYWARVTGCAVVLTDVPLDGLRLAQERADQDRLSSCWVVGADATALPFASAAFHVITHSDVLCCLKPKQLVLAGLRRLIRADGLMAFTVISIVPGLPERDRRRAVESGPSFIDAPTDYVSMLREADWHITERLDVTLEYSGVVQRLLRQEETMRDDLIALLGSDDYHERLAQRRRTADAIEQGLIQRELFIAAPSSRPVGQGEF